MDGIMYHAAKNPIDKFRRLYQEKKPITGPDGTPLHDMSNLSAVAKYTVCQVHARDPQLHLRHAGVPMVICVASADMAVGVSGRSPRCILLDDMGNFIDGDLTP
jgi:hypothetical protein